MATTFMSFKQKLIITFMVFIVLPLVALGFGTYYFYSQAMEQKVSGFVEQVAVSTASNIEMHIKELEKFTLLPYYNRELQDLLTLEDTPAAMTALEKKETIEKNFSLWQSQRESVQRIYYFSFPGLEPRRIYNQGYLPSSFTVEMMPWYEEFSQSEDNVRFITLHKPIANYFNDVNDEHKVFSLIRKIYKSTTLEEYAGYFEVDFKLDEVERIMQLVNREENGSFFITDQTGQMIYANQALDYDIMAELGESLLAGQGKQMLRFGHEKNIVVASQVGEYGWTVVGSVPVAQIMSGIVNVRNSMIVLGVVLILIAILTSTVFSLQLTKPIYRLITLIKRVEKEDFQITYDNPPRNEIGHLIKSVIRMSTRLDETIRNLYQAEIVRKESELQSLKAQINPHFLFNTLETIKMKAEVDEADDTVKMVTALGKLVKASVFRGNDFITFQEEMASIKNYFYIQESRYATRFDMSIEVEEAILGCYVPKIIIQPLIENAFYHGLEMKQGKGNLRVVAGAEEGAIRIQVIDDGLGMSKERLEQLEQQFQNSMAYISKSGRSIGLTNVYARMQLYFGSEFTMAIDSEPGEGTVVTLRFPMIRNESEVMVYVSRHTRG